MGEHEKRPHSRTRRVVGGAVAVVTAVGAIFGCANDTLGVADRLAGLFRSDTAANEGSTAAPTPTTLEPSLRSVYATTGVIKNGGAWEASDGTIWEWFRYAPALYAFENTGDRLITVLGVCSPAGCDAEEYDFAATRRSTDDYIVNARFEIEPGEIWLLYVRQHEIGAPRRVTPQPDGRLVIPAAPETRVTLHLSGAVEWTSDHVSDGPRTDEDRDAGEVFWSRCGYLLDDDCLLPGESRDDWDDVLNDAEGWHPPLLLGKSRPDTTEV